MAFASYDEKSIDGAIKRGDTFLSEWERERDDALQTLTEERRLAEEDLQKVDEVRSKLNDLPNFADSITETDLAAVRNQLQQARDVIKQYLQDSAEALEEIKRS